MRTGDTQNLISTSYKITNVISPMRVCEGAYICDGDPEPSTYYVWDSVRYLYKTIEMPYDHPDKIYYNISQYTNWSKEGTNYIHSQLNKYDSGSIVGVAPWVAGAIIGGVIGGLVGGPIGGTAGAVIGTLVAGVITSIIGAWGQPQLERLLDEDGCLWIVIDKEITLEWRWLPLPNYYYHIDYLSIGDHKGSLTFNDLYLPS